MCVVGTRIRPEVVQSKVNDSIYIGNMQGHTYGVEEGDLCVGRMSLTARNLSMMEMVRKSVSVWRSNAEWTCTSQSANSFLIFTLKYFWVAMYPEVGWSWIWREGGREGGRGGREGREGAREGAREDTEAELATTSR